MTKQQNTLLDPTLTTKDRPVLSKAVLTAADRHRILDEWNQTTTDYPRDKCVHELFEEQARETPEAVAVVFEGERLTYHQLNHRSNLLAGRLIELGAGPDFLVGICAERSVEMIVGLLAILKAGGAYVPIDPSQPLERTASLLEDAALQVVMAQSRFIRALPRTKAKIVSLDNSPAKKKAASPVRRAGAESLAYVLFTSGSTGRPKGVCVPHRGVTRLVKNTNYARFGPEERFLQLAPPAFDASTFEIWGALLNGATLFVPPPGPSSLSELGQFIKNAGITTLWLTSGLFNQMVEEQIESLAGVRQLLAGGDVLSAAHVRKAMRGLPHCQIINGYGPTENTTFTCCQRLGEADVHGPRIPIGRPVANTTVLILDENLQPVPVGVTGELHTGGDGLARGYLNQPELTSASFIPNPFSNHPGARLYKTGDLCRYLPDGRIEFLGRRDRQVKIRGFRVELGEIEAALESHSAVGQAVVTAREDRPGEKQLAAYVVARRSAPAPSGAELRAFLKTRLPDYLLPASFTGMKSLPLAPNGKIDRAALPLPGSTSANLERAGPVPRNFVEQRLAALWAEQLGAAEIGIHENVFDLGGHSLMTLRLQRTLETTFGVSLPMDAFFENPTVARLARVVGGTRLSGPSARTVSAKPGETTPPLFVLHDLIMARRLEKHLENERTVHGVGSPFDEAMNEWRAAGRMALTVEELAAWDVKIIKRLQPSGPYHLAGYCFGGVVAFEAAGQLTRQGEKVASLAIMDALYHPGCAPLRFGRLRSWLDRAAQLAGKTPAKIFSRLQRRIRPTGSHGSPKAALREARAREAATGELERFLAQMLEAYRGRSYEGPALLFRARARPLSWKWAPGRAYGWDKVIASGLQVEDIWCDHLQIPHEPHVATIADKLRQHLLGRHRDENAKARPAADRTFFPDEQSRPQLG